jgi:hypothetical protein
VRHVSVFASFVALLGLVLGTAPVRAQVGETTDIITGIVADVYGEPLAGVEIEAFSLDLEISRIAATDRSGRYMILFPDGGGQYRLTARLIGAMPQTVIMVRQADEDRLIWDVQLREAGFVLDPLVVTGDSTIRRVQPREGRNPGERQIAFTPDMVANLPIDPEDLAMLAALVPGAVLIDATDSTDAAYSIAGQGTDANVTTLDGMTFGSGQMPQEGLRATRVVTSTYDVSRGRFSGGMMASTTRTGSNNVQASLSYSLRDDDLAFGEGGLTTFAAGSTQHAFGAGVGIPVIHNRLFAYVSGSLRARRDPFASLTSATVDDLIRLGVAPDSVDRFMTIVNDVGAAPESRYEGNRRNDQLSGMLRMDYLISNRHTLMLRGDIRDVGQEPTRVGATALPETGGDNVTSAGGLMVSLASQFGQRAINQLRAYASINTRAGDPYWLLPQGRVQVRSVFDDGSTGINTLTMGGNTFTPTGSTSRSIEVSDEVSVFTGGASHRLKLGTLFRVEETDDFASNNQFGVYTYSSLEALETDSPASFRRVLNAPDRKATMLEWAAYVGDAWMPSRTFQVNYGLRAEVTTLKNVPAYNPTVDASLGVKTDELPSEFDVSPRLGFTWRVGSTGFATPPAFIITGGVGKFRSPMSLRLVSQAQSGTGLADSESILECTGSSVPIPDWSLYRNDAAMILDECVGPPTLVDLGTPAVTAFAQDFGSTKSWRASLGVQRSLTTLLRASVNFTYARGVDQYGYQDVNLDTDGGFTIASEENRPVFVPASTIAPATGAVNSRASRIDSSFAQVLHIGSHLENESKQLTFSLGGVTRSGVVVRSAYTWSHVRDQSSLRGGGGGGGGRSGSGFGGSTGGTTSGNPNVPEWGRSSLERRHSFLLTVSYPFGPSLDVTSIGRLSSGRPYTPVVATDINGDGAANDQAFIFDPATNQGMAQLLGSTSSGARECLERQIGTVASRNSCLGPWEGTLEFQVNYRPSFWDLNHRLMVSLTTINFLGGLDRLLHGSDGLKGWGMRAQPDSRLLYVTDFDPVAQQFLYAVNERFGASDPQRTAFQQPFQIGIPARVSLGPDRCRDALLRMRGAGGGMMGRGGRPGIGGRPGAGAGGFRGGGITGANFLERFRSLLVNPAEYVLDLVDLLDLTHQQIDRLDFLRDSLGIVNDSIGTALQTEIEEAAAGAEQDPRALMEVIRPAMQRVQENLTRGLAAVREVLTDEQWDILPERVRNLGSRLGMPGGGIRRPDQ